MLENSYGKKQASYYDYARAEMRPFVPAGIRRMLDVGCGRGSFAHYFKQTANVETWGIEMMPDAAAEAEKALDRVFCGDFQSLAPTLPAASFDVIVCNDVLEHMLEPEEALRQMSGLLAPRGAIVASIPNFLFWPNLRELLIDRDWRYRDAGILDRTHLRFFTRKSILRLFDDTGYSVQRCEGINSYVGPPRYRWARHILKRPLADFSCAQYAVVAKVRPEKDIIAQDHT